MECPHCNNPIEKPEKISGQFWYICRKGECGAPDGKGMRPLTHGHDAEFKALEELREYIAKKAREDEARKQLQ